MEAVLNATRTRAKRPNARRGRPAPAPPSCLAHGPDRTTGERKSRQARHDAEHAAMRRWQSDLFRFWRDCPNGPCRRAKHCSGDAVTCMAQRWPTLPEEYKVWYRVVIEALLADTPAAQASEAGIAAALEYLRRNSETAESAAAGPNTAPPMPQPSPAPAAASDAPAPAPRVRLM